MTSTGTGCFFYGVEEPSLRLIITKNPVNSPGLMTDLVKEMPPKLPWLKRLSKKTSPLLVYVEGHSCSVLCQAERSFSMSTITAKTTLLKPEMVAKYFT